MLDLVIRSDRVVTPSGVAACDVAIQGEKIAAVAASGTFSAGSAKRVIDMTGKIVMPGGIDPHVHCKWYSPHPDGSGVDLHWSIAPDVVDARRIRVIWEHSRPPRPGASLPGSRLSPEMTLVHLAKHFHSHQYRAPKPLVDFYVASRVLRHETSAQALFAAARSLGLVPVVDVAIRLCERSFLPGSLAHFAEARPPTTSARLARVVISDRFMIEADERARVANWLRYLVAAGGVRAAWESIVGLVVPSRLLLMQFFNRPVNAFSYALYYWRQLKKVVTLSNRWTG